MWRGGSSGGTSMSLHTVRAQRADERSVEADAGGVADEAAAGDKAGASECCWSSWHSMTSKHGYPVTGIRRPQSLVSDIHSCELEPAPMGVGDTAAAAVTAEQGMLCVTGSCDGHVRLFAAPCIARHAPCVQGLVGLGEGSGHTAAHSSVAKARFIPAESAPAAVPVHGSSRLKSTSASQAGRSTHVISVGGRDGCVVQWRLLHRCKALQLPESHYSPKSSVVASVGSQSPPAGAGGCYLADLVANAPWQQ